METIIGLHAFFERRGWIGVYRGYEGLIYWDDGEESGNYSNWLYRV